MRFEINETCNNCGAKFSPIKDYYFHWSRWMTHFGVRCPDCGVRYYYFSNFEMAACILLVLITVIVLIAALLGVRI
jgi:DNA-directed RNA polymerase subunit RPC12/RpoP